MQCGYLASTTLVSATCPLFVDMITTALLRFDVIHYLSLIHIFYRVGQARDDVAGIGDVERSANLGAFVEFVELPLGCLGMKVRRALAHDFRSSRRQKQLQPFHVSSSGKLLPLVIHPENAEGEHCIHRRLRLFGIDAEHGKRRLTGPQHGARVHRAERMFQIGAAAQVLDFHPGILAQQDPLQQALILSASCVLGGALAPVRVEMCIRDRRRNDAFWSGQRC